MKIKTLNEVLQDVEFDYNEKLNGTALERREQLREVAINAKTKEIAYEIILVELFSGDSITAGKMEDNGWSFDEAENTWKSPEGREYNA